MAETIKLAERLKTPTDSRAKIVAFLEKHLKNAREGLVSEVLIVSKGRDGLWQFDQGGDATATDMIGRLEIVKHEIVAKYIEDANAE
jgi:hypothetical protein